MTTGRLGDLEQVSGCREDAGGYAAASPGRRGPTCPAATGVRTSRARPSPTGQAVRAGAPGPGAAWPPSPPLRPGAPLTEPLCASTPPRAQLLTVTAMAEPLRDPKHAYNVVEVGTADGGLALIIYGPGPDFLVDDVCFVPAEDLRAEGA